MPYCIWFFWFLLSLSFVLIMIRKGIYVNISYGCVCVCLFLFFFVGFLGVITSDWVSYKAIVREQYLTKCTAVTNIESFWKWLSVMVEGNIYLFRLFVYGATYILMFFLLYFSVPKKQLFFFLFLYAILGLYGASEGRQILSVILFYLLLSLWIRRNIPRLILLPFFILCFYLHKGTILFLPSLFLLYIPLSRKVLFVSIISTIFVSLFLFYYLPELLEYYFPEYNYSFYVAYNVERDISRRILYVLIFGNLLLTILVFFLLKRSFKLTLDKMTEKYRNFLYWNYMLYCCLYFLNFDSSTTGRYIGLMLLHPIILLIVKVVEDGVENKTINSFFYKFLYALLFFSFIANNIIISACLDIGEF